MARAINDLSVLRDIAFGPGTRLSTSRKPAREYLSHAEQMFAPPAVVSNGEQIDPLTRPVKK